MGPGTSDCTCHVRLALLQKEDDLAENERKELEAAEVVNMYSALQRYVLSEGDTSIARCRLFLEANGGLLALGAYVWQTLHWFGIAAGAIGVVLCYVWATGNERANTYISYWFAHLRRLERSIPGASTFTQGELLAKQGVCVDGVPYVMPALCRRWSVKRGYTILAVLLGVGWLSVLIASALGVLPPQP